MNLYDIKVPNRSDNVISRTVILDYVNHEIEKGPFTFLHS